MSPVTSGCLPHTCLSSLSHTPPNALSWPPELSASSSPSSVLERILVEPCFRAVTIKSLPRGASRTFASSQTVRPTGVASTVKLSLYVVPVLTRPLPSAMDPASGAQLQCPTVHMLTMMILTGVQICSCCLPPPSTHIRCNLLAAAWPRGLLFRTGCRSPAGCQHPRRPGTRATASNGTGGWTAPTLRPPVGAARSAKTGPSSPPPALAFRKPPRLQLKPPGRTQAVLDRHVRRAGRLPDRDGGGLSPLNP